MPVLKLYIKYLLKIFLEVELGVTVVQCFEFLKVFAIDKDFLRCMYFGCHSHMTYSDGSLFCLHVCFQRYYALEVSYFKSSLDRKLLELLWNKYWVNTLSSSSLLTVSTIICYHVHILTH